MPETVEQMIADFGGHASPGSWFLAETADIEKHEALLPYAHYLRQAWSELKLSGVLCVDRRPTVYLCAGNEFSVEQKRQFHRYVWNQGLVPLLLFVTPGTVEAHSAVKKPEKEESGRLFAAEPASLIPILNQTAKALESARLVRAIETGQFFLDNAQFFPPNEAVDRCLVENLVHTAKRLKATGWTLPRAHALLGRALFVTFLQERSFIKPHYYPDGTTSLLDILSRPRFEEVKRLLYREFFPRLQQEFNGTMFDTALGEEARNISKAHLDILGDFLSGHDMESGQMTLGFWAYDFQSIPVETISAIYEEFLKDTDLSKKRNDGAYYTPRHLAETTLHVALDGRYVGSQKWRALDPACGSGIFLVAMFNLLAEQWLRSNSSSRRQTKAQALLDILQTRIRGVDVNPDACRIAAFSLYLALFEKLKPMDVDEFKEKVRQGPFLPPLLWTADAPVAAPIVIHGNFLKDTLPLENNFDLVIGNPPWESRGIKQIALHFAQSSISYLRDGGIGCLLLPSTILVNRNGTLDGAWFRTVTVEKIIQLADFRFVLFEATHPCFVLRYVKSKPAPAHTVAYETPKLNRFDRQTGVFVIEPDDQKLVPQRDILEAALEGRLQGIWSRKFWGTPRDEALLRRLDFYPPLSELVGVRGKPKRWLGGTGFQPHYEDRMHKRYTPVDIPWRMSEPFLDAREDLGLVVFEDQLTTLGERLKELGASRKKVLFARHEKNFQPPMVVLNNGFTKFAFSAHATLFQDALRSITGPAEDEELLRFLAAVLGSRLMQYVAFHSGSSNGIGRDKLHLYESLSLPFPLPDHELAPANAKEIVKEAATITRQVERSGKSLSPAARAKLIEDSQNKLEFLVERFYSVSDAEKLLIEDTLNIFQLSIHSRNFESSIPTLATPERADRKRYADRLCAVLNHRSRKKSIAVRAEAMVSEELKLILLTVIFGDKPRAYAETGGDVDLWNALERVSKAAEHSSGPFSYLRGFSYFEKDRLHMLKPASMRNWCPTAALNDADAIFEHLARKDA